MHFVYFAVPVAQGAPTGNRPFGTRVRSLPARYVRFPTGGTVSIYALARFVWLKNPEPENSVSVIPYFSVSASQRFSLGSVHNS